MPTVLTAILGLFAAFALFLCRRNHQAIQKLEGTPTTAIADLTEGHHEIKGRVSEASTTVRAPMAGEDCVWFSLKVEESVRREKGRRWIVRGRLTRHGECVVEDETGTCHVDLGAADHDLLRGARGATGTFDDPSEGERAALAAVGLSSENFLGLNRRLRFRETVLRRGDPLFAHGPCELDDAGQPTLRTRGEDRVFFSNRSEEALVRSHKVWRAIQLVVFLASAVGAVASLGG